MPALLASCLSLCALLAAAGPPADVPPPSGAEIVAPEARLEHLFTRSANLEGGLTEGPAAAPDGAIYFTDIPFGRQPGMILRFDPASGHTAAFSLDSGKANGLAFTAEGRLVACEGANVGGRRLVSYDIRTGEKQVLAERFEGKRFNSPNDLCLDRAGRVYFSDPRYVGEEPRELEHRAVYCWEPGGEVFRVTTEVSKPNGLAISPDGRTLYVAETDNGTDRIDPAAPPPALGDQRIYAFPLGENGRVAGERRTLLDFHPGFGCDGMTVDTQGRLYLAVREARRPGILVVDPKDGREVGFIPTGPPEQQPAAGHAVRGLPSNVEFGRGEESNVLYITIDVSLYRIPLLTRGYRVEE